MTRHTLQDVIALAEQNIGHTQKENMYTHQPNPNDPALSGAHKHPSSSYTARIPPRHISLQGGALNVARLSRARHKRSPENVHSLVPSNNVFVRANPATGTGTASATSAATASAPQPLSMSIPLHSPPSLPIQIVGDRCTAAERKAGTAAGSRGRGPRLDGAVDAAATCRTRPKMVASRNLRRRVILI